MHEQDGLISDSGDVTRRQLWFVITKIAAVASGQQFLGSWMKAAETAANAHAHGAVAPPEPDRWTNYRPQFFAPPEFGWLQSFSEILIPTDETPGAREAHVAHYIDFVVHAAAEYAPDIQERWRGAMTWLRQSEWGSLSAEAKQRLVEEAAAPELDHSKSHPGFEHYRLIKTMTVHAFYTSRVGLIDVLEYKGNAYLTEFPGCKHPEHHRV